MKAFKVMHKICLWILTVFFLLMALGSIPSYGTVLMMLFLAMDRRYFSYFLQTPLMKKQVDEIVSGGTIPTMSQQKMSNFYLVCPTLERQTTIADAIDKRVELIDEMIKEKEELIRDLSSYKDSLIYEIITGKKEV